MNLDWVRHNIWLVSLGLVTALCLVTMSVAIVFRAHDQQQINSLVQANRERLADISALVKKEQYTNGTLCKAVVGARNFWIGIRQTTLELLQDPSLSPVERASNEHYVQRLDAVIKAAGLLSKGCPKQ